MPYESIRVEPVSPNIGAEVSEIDLSGYATIASTILRIGSKLGLQRRAHDVTPPDPLTYAREHGEYSDHGIFDAYEVNVVDRYSDNGNDND